VSIVSATVSGGLIDANTASRGGGVSLWEATIADATITNNIATWGGGGVDTAVTGPNNVTDCTIEDNTAQNTGGGVNVDEPGLFTITRGTISGNTVLSSSGVGGGVAGQLDFDTNAPDIDIVDTVISGNSAASGGGVWTDDGSLDISGVTFDQNGADTGGGLFLANEYPTVTIVGGGFTSNTATVTAGAIYVEWGTITATAVDMGSGPTQNTPNDTAGMSGGPDDFDGAFDSFTCNYQGCN